MIVNEILFVKNLKKKEKSKMKQAECIMDLPDDKCQMKMEIYQTEKERSRKAKKRFQIKRYI